MTAAACQRCRTLHHRDEADAACAAQLDADTSLLNSKHVTICGHRQHAGMTRETIHALADLLRCVLTRTATPGERWQGGPR